MSNALAIAGVSAVLKDLLDTGLIDHQVTDALGAGVSVTAVAPDSIKLDAVNFAPRLNLFLHQVTPNSGWRNAGLPSRDDHGRRLTNPPLALDLHYLLTAYGATDLQAEVLLGYGMHLLHETPVLGRNAIRTALEPPVVNGTLLPTTFKALRASALAEQVEQIKITPAAMNSEEMSRLWSALQAHYRPTAPYVVTVVLIEAERPARSPLPVLSRGPVDPVTSLDRGVVVQPDMLPPVPEITGLLLPGGQPSAKPGDVVQVEGHHLDGINRAVRLVEPRRRIDVEVAAGAGGGFARLNFTVPVAVGVLPAGTYRITALVRRPAETARRETNELSLSIAPEITTALPLAVARDAQGRATITLNCRPQVLPAQRASLLLGSRETPAQPHPNPTSSLTFHVLNAQPGTYLARLRVEGVDSQLVNRAARPPVFFNHRITIT